MRNRHTRICILFCLILLLIGLLTACGNESASQEPDPADSAPVLRILTIGSCSEQALTRISAAVSEITLSRLGCRVELQVTSEAEFDARVDDLLLESDLADIIVCPNRSVLTELMDGNYVYRLDYFLDGYPVFHEAVPDEARWAEVSQGNYCYGIPFGNDRSYTWGFLMRQDVCQELGIDPASIDNLDALHQVLLQVQAARPDLVPVVPDGGEMETFVDYAPLSDDIGVLSQDGTVCSIESLPEFAEICTIMRQWYQEGLILKNAPFNTHSRTDWFSSGLAFGSFARVGQYTCRELSYACGAGICCVPLGEMQNNSGMEDGCFGIYAFAQDVNLCLQLLELLYTDPQLLTLCVYGEEGVDYTISETGAAVPVEGQPEAERYYIWNWPMRDLAPQPLTVEEAPEAPESVTAGFVFDGSGLSNELYQCEEVWKKYYNPLCAGMLDPEDSLAMMQAEMAGAQQDAVLAEKQRQWTAWLEGKP